jgi:hypothetical protein
MSGGAKSREITNAVRPAIPMCCEVLRVNRDSLRFSENNFRKRNREPVRLLKVVTSGFALLCEDSITGTLKTEINFSTRLCVCDQLIEGEIVVAGPFARWRVYMRTM